jgi:uroporphyrin-III C-methyltransferase
MSELPDTPPARENPLIAAVSRMNLTQMTLALLVLIFVWQWFDAHHQINQMQQELARRLAEMDGLNKANQTLVTQNQEAVRELGGKLGVLESKYAEAQSQRAALENLYQEMSSSRDQIALAEVEQAVLMAGQQLQLAANVKAALIALQQADSRLQRLDRPALHPLRLALAHDIDKLRALPDVDVAGINVRLDSLILAVDELPLAQDMTPAVEPLAAPAEQGNAWQILLREVWREAKNLVRIENTGKRELPLLSPTQTFFLRENLKLRLLSARLALLSRDEASYKYDVKAAQEWVTQYFDATSNDGAVVLNKLKKLSAASINIELPDLNVSLQAVRSYRASREKSVR